MMMWYQMRGSFVLSSALQLWKLNKGSDGGKGVNLCIGWTKQFQGLTPFSCRKGRRVIRFLKNIRKILVFGLEFEPEKKHIGLTGTFRSLIESLKWQFADPYCVDGWTESHLYVEQVYNICHSRPSINLPILYC